MKELQYSKDIKEELIKVWNKGLILRQKLSINQAQIVIEFPYKIKLKQPASKDRADISNFNKIKDWCKHWNEQSDKFAKDGIKINIDKTSINDRNLGKQELPAYIVVNDINSFIHYIKKEKEIKKFEEIAKVISNECPNLLNLMNDKPFDFLKYDTLEWHKIIQVSIWIANNPNPNIYLRELEIPNIDTKFIEKHDGILKKVINFFINKEENDFSTNNFEERYGFKRKPVTVRFRILDEKMAINGLTDLEIPIEDFANLKLPAKKAFIIENKITGLSFPDVKSAIVIFGLGYGLDRLKKCYWLNNLELYYWGDLDTNGFVMLDQFRSYFSSVKSMLMTSEIIKAHKDMWVTEEKQTDRELSHLTEDETNTYKELIENKYANNLRLEQERINFTFVKEFLNGK